MELDTVEIGFFTVKLYPATAQRIAEACIAAAGNSDEAQHMLTLGSALQAAALAAEGKDFEFLLRGKRASQGAGLLSEQVAS